MSNDHKRKTIAECRASGVYSDEALDALEELAGCSCPRSPVPFWHGSTRSAQDLKCPIHGWPKAQLILRNGARIAFVDGGGGRLQSTDPEGKNIVYGPAPSASEPYPPCVQDRAAGHDFAARSTTPHVPGVRRYCVDALARAVLRYLLRVSRPATLGAGASFGVEGEDAFVTRMTGGQIDPVDAGVLSAPRFKTETGEARLCLEMLRQAIRDAGSAKPHLARRRRQARAWLRDASALLSARQCFAVARIDYEAALAALEAKWKGVGE